MKLQPAMLFWGALGALGLILVAEWLPANAPPPVVKAPGPVNLAHAEADAPERETESWADAINARPLFTIGRQPRHESGGTHVVSASGLPRLSGILISARDRRAIFMPDSGKPITVAEGGALDDSTVRRILPDRVVLAGPKGEITLRLSFDKLHAFVGGTPGAPGAPVFPTGLFNPNPGANGGGPGMPFPNPVHLPFGQPPQPPAPAPTPPNGEGGDDDGAADANANAPPHPAQIHPNLPRDRE